MPGFEYRGKHYNNPVELALDKVGGKWKMPILWRIKDHPWRYSELRRSFEKNKARITHQMLSRHLKELESDGLLHREAFPEVPLRVEYSITEAGRAVLPVIEALREYGLSLMREEEIEEAQ